MTRLLRSALRAEVDGLNVILVSPTPPRTRT
jgi:hypothetical protein